ncbi:MAG: class I SAM-dependent methyltransferase [Planctomycetes bacterium]|nr:class I SAM-dependent methyltransferase [Planctomycetota bacterium]
MAEGSLEQFGNRLARMHKHLRKWGRRTGASCWRLYEREIADQPLIVDWYDGDVVCWASERTRNETPEQEEAWLAAVVATIARALAVAPEQVFLKRRQRQEDRQHGGQYQPLERRGATKVVAEGALRFEVNLSDYLDTGLFLDHRPLRARVGAESTGKAVLNLFCYTGAFTCHAALGAAATTLSVDLSNTYLDWAARNLELNGQAVGERHRLVKADCLAWLAAAPRQAARFDLIVCDPPTFSNSTAMQEPFSVDRDHPGLIAGCARLLTPGGRLYFSTNSRGFELHADQLPGLTAKDITASTIPEDFRGRRSHRCWLVGT